MQRTCPYGSWRSPLSAELVSGAMRRLGQPQLRDGVCHWLEGRPQEGGRQTVMRARPGESPEDVTPNGANVRTRVHEYGGGDYTLGARELYYVADGEPGIRRLSGESPLGSAVARYADAVESPCGRRLVAVEERHPPGGGEPENRLVAFDLATGEERAVASGHDFYASPCFSPDGTQLAYLAWDHPDMPWDSTMLYVLGWSEAGPTGAARLVAGGGEESIFQPRFSPGGRLTFVSDRSGFWNLHQLRASGPVALCPRAAEFGWPQWVFGLSKWAFEDEGRILCVVGESAQDRLARLDVETGALRDVPLPFTDIAGLQVEGGLACFLGAGPECTPTVCTLELESGRLERLRPAADLELAEGLVSRAEAVEFASAGGRTAHAFLYAPRNPEYAGPRGKRPPLLVMSHGGPTAATSSSLRLGVQYWTSRGFAVADVNYGGSSGYGREYRNRLRGAWGIVDVEDCAHAALFAAAEGLADGERLAITGGSAGGYTTLCALTFRDEFAVGASHYGIGDLEALARDTHKFESRYLDRLVGPYPERRDLYRARSPIHHTDRLECPVIFFQGLEDAVVPPNQAEAMVAALAARGIPHAYVPFEGEQHGFRRAENIRAALEGELSFYGQILGFEVDGGEPVPIVRPG